MQSISFAYYKDPSAQCCIIYIYHLASLPKASFHGKLLIGGVWFSIAHVVQSSGQQVPQWMLDLKKPSKNEKRQITTKRGHVSRAVQHEKVEKRRKK